jgi:hypothetical protein
VYFQTPLTASASFKQVISSSSLKGFARKPIAPAPSACARALISEKAVTKMIGSRMPWAISLLCNSMPFMPGICTSLIKQSVSCKRSDFKNASADANWTIVYPSDRMKLIVARRKESSSSTIAITGIFDKVVPLDQPGHCDSLCHTQLLSRIPRPHLTWINPAVVGMVMGGAGLVACRRHAQWAS